MKFVDLHCDTIGCLARMEKEEAGLRANHLHVDLEKMKKGDALLQCFALYIETTPDGVGYNGQSPYEIFEQERACYERELQKNADLLAPVHMFSDISKNEAAGKVSALLTVEDAVFLDGKIERVRECCEKGVRLLTFTWNYENSLGFPNGSTDEQGLKPFGFAVLEEMNALGMIADVSHLSDRGFWDVAGHAKKPFVASHSNARALCDVPRNLTDEMLRALGETGGVAGLNFAAFFLTPGSSRTTISDLLRHAVYMADKAGIDAVALGSDFDGIKCTLEFQDYSGMPMIEEALHTVFTADEVDKITHLNALRVFRDCIG